MAQAIIHRPELLLLDEPFSGLDPVGRLEFKEILSELRSAGCTILLSSHVLSDIERLCDRVSIMNRGVIQRIFSIGEMPTLFGEESHLVFVGNDSLRSVLQNAAEIRTRSHPAGTEFSARFRSRIDGEQALTFVMNHGAIIHEYRIASPSLEDVFVAITQGDSSR